MTGKDKLVDFYKTKRAAMFVANHNSWLDIPFIGHTIGWRNYKLVSKAELGKVPILGKSIKIGGHLMLDRTDRKSQLATVRQGMDLLKVSIGAKPFVTRSAPTHTCTDPLPFRQIDAGWNSPLYVPRGNSLQRWPPR